MGGPGGRRPPGGGLWGVPPHKDKRGNELPTLANPPRVGPKTLANPQPTRVGNGGSRGAKPPGKGPGGCAPKSQRRGRVADPCNPATSGTQNASKPKANEGGKMGGPGGRSPLARGLGDVPPKAKGGGEMPTPATPPRVGPKTPANPKPTRVGKWGGPGGRRPPGRGLWGCPPTKTKEGTSCPH